MLNFSPRPKDSPEWRCLWHTVSANKGEGTVLKLVCVLIQSKGASKEDLRRGNWNRVFSNASIIHPHYGELYHSWTCSTSINPENDVVGYLMTELSASTQKSIKSSLDYMYSMGQPGGEFTRQLKTAWLSECGHYTKYNADNPALTVVDCCTAYLE